jgi:hypothetical protein
VPTNLPNGKGGVATAKFLGGRGMLNYNADGSIAFTFDLVASLQHAIQGAVALGTAGLSYLGQLQQQITQRVQAGQLTIQQGQKLQQEVALAKIALEGQKGDQANTALQIVTPKK